MRYFFAPAVFMYSILLMASASADPAKAVPDNERPRAQLKSSLTDSVRRVERQTGGEVLSAEPSQQGGRQVNRVKVLTNDGRVRVMQVDPQQNRSKRSPPARVQNEADKDGGDPAQY